jgi:hypothetical protein
VVSVVRRRGLLIAPEAARELDGKDLAEVEVGNRLESLAGGAVAGGFGQGIEPGGIFGLQGDQLGYRSAPAPGPARAMSLRGLATGRRRVRRRWRCIDILASAVARLALGTGHRLLAGRPASAWHRASLVFRHVTLFGRLSCGS